MNKEWKNKTHKIYYENNKDKIKQKQKEYYNIRKEKILKDNRLRYNKVNESKEKKLLNNLRKLSIQAKKENDIEGAKAFDKVLNMIKEGI